MPSHTADLEALATEHAERLREIPHPTASHAKRGRTMLGFALHHVRRGSTGETLERATHIVRESLGFRSRGRPWRTASRQTRLHGALRAPLEALAAESGHPVRWHVDALAGACDVVPWPDPKRLRLPSSEPAAWPVRVGIEVADRFARPSLDMSWSLALVLGVEL